MIRKLRGMTVPLLTPFDSKGKISYQMLEAHLDYLYLNGIRNFFIGGTSGEFINLSMPERLDLIKAVKESLPEDAVIMNNITALNMSDLLKILEFSQDYDIDLLSVTPPYYHKHDSLALKRYFKTIDEIVSKPMLYLYNIPALANNSIDLEVFEFILRECKNFIGIKDSCMSLTNLLCYQNISTREFDFVTGNDAEILAALFSGATGAVVASANVFPFICKGIFDSYNNGNIILARQLQNLIISFRGIVRATVPIVAHKRALEILGEGIGGPRYPMRSLTEREDEEVKKVVETLIHSYKEIIKE